MGNWKKWIVPGVVVLLLLGAWSTYNKLVRLHEAMPAAWAQVENVLQRRYDLIPNLVATVKGYAKHEKDVLTEVTRMRSQWGAAKSPADKVKAANGLEGAIGRLLLVTENYPTLKANENFSKLMDELSGTENRIAVERMRYNEVIRDYNTTVKMFPTNLVAKMAGFSTSEFDYFKSAKEAATAPKVEF